MIRETCVNCGLLCEGLLTSHWFDRRSQDSWGPARRVLGDLAVKASGSVGDSDATAEGERLGQETGHNKEQPGHNGDTRCTECSRKTQKWGDLHCFWAK